MITRFSDRAVNPFGADEEFVATAAGRGC